MSTKIPTLEEYSDQLWNSSPPPTKDPTDQRSLVRRLSEAMPVKPEPADSFAGRMGQSLNRGIDQVQEIAGGTLFAVGKVTGLNGLRDYGERFSINAGNQATINSPRVVSLSETQNFGDIVEYGSSVLLETIPLFMVSFLVVLFFRKLNRWYWKTL